MATFEERLDALIVAIAGDVKALRLADGSLAALNTVSKENLVAAINEVMAIAATSTALINDSASLATLDKVWSVKKASDEIQAAIISLRNELRGGASAALDTFSELAAQLSADQSTAAALATAVANRVRYDMPQLLSPEQKIQALTNIGALATESIGNYDADLVAAYTAAKA